MEEYSSADYGRLAYLKIEDVLRRVLFLEGEVKRLKERLGE